jgi:hypothetical protein
MKTKLSEIEEAEYADRVKWMRRMNRRILFTTLTLLAFPLILIGLGSLGFDFTILVGDTSVYLWGGAVFLCIAWLGIDHVLFKRCCVCRDIFEMRGLLPHEKLHRYCSRCGVDWFPSSTEPGRRLQSIDRDEE